MQERIEREVPADEAAQLWTATYVLMGLKYDRAFARRLLQGVREMRESVTYQAILEEGEAMGEVKEARNLLLKLGRKRFGEPEEATLAILNAITSVERLEQLAERLLEAESWSEMLQ